ncbi:MAG: hypothetical protein LBF75_07710 [Treponema sp.]|jgi:hypothetical protein|nr:hypothetical protein [Treponema sp.]
MSSLIKIEPSNEIIMTPVLGLDGDMVLQINISTDFIFEPFVYPVEGIHI